MDGARIRVLGYVAMEIPEKVKIQFVLQNSHLQPQCLGDVQG